MSVLIDQKKELTVTTENTSLSSIWGPGNRIQQRVDIPVTSIRYTLPQIRMEKVLAIRQQLAEGNYDLDERLDAALDQLLQTLNA